jgi:hypothetical protein
VGVRSPSRSSRSQGHLIRLTLAAVAPADALNCRSADLRYAGRSGPKDFGVRKLQITGGTCTTARRVAAAYTRAFQHHGPTRHVLGFSFVTLGVPAAQTYSERGRRGGTTIRFWYLFPIY